MVMDQFDHRTKEKVQMRWFEKPWINEKTWAEILNQVNIWYPVEADLVQIYKGEQEHHGEQEQQPKGSKDYDTGVKFFKTCLRP